MPKIPGLTTGEKQDITFPASLLATALSSFGLEQAKKGSKKDDKVAQNEGMIQTIRVITPIKIEGAEVIDPKPQKSKSYFHLFLQSQRVQHMPMLRLNM